MLLLSKVKLTDFLSHESTTIELKPDSKILLEGPSGVGKSSIVDAIIWTLYGIGRSDNRSLIRKGCKKASVILEIYDETTEYTITRSINAGSGKHTLQVTVKNRDSSLDEGVAHPISGLRELQNWIEKDLVGASYVLFVNSVAYIQGNAESFVSQNATKRKELLLELVKAEDYEVYYEKARARLGELDVEEARLEIEGKNSQQWLSESKGRLLAKPILEKNIIKCREHINDIDNHRTRIISRLGEIKNSQDMIRSWQGIIETHERELVVFIKEIAQLEAVQGSLSGIDEASLRSKIALSKDVEQDRISILSSKPTVTDRSVDIERFRKQIEEYKTLHQCPSGDKCPHQVATISAIGRLSENIKEAIRMTQEEKRKMEVWQTKYDSLPGPVDIHALSKTLHTIESLKTLPQKRNDLEAIKKTLEEAKSKISEIDIASSAQERSLLESELTSVDAALYVARKEESTTSGELSLLGSIEGVIAERERGLKILRETLSSLEEQRSSLEMVKEAFGSKGIKTVIVDYILPRLEDSVNEVLSKLSDFRVRFDTQKSSVDGESQVEGLFITIINESGEELAFENYSGGEKLKITVAISEALAGLQKVGFRIFDETFIGLDDASTESFASVLAKMQERFGQVICISHLTTIKDMFDQVITVRKHDGVSSVDLSTGRAIISELAV